MGGSSDKIRIVFHHWYNAYFYDIEAIRYIRKLRHSEIRQTYKQNKKGFSWVTENGESIWLNALKYLIIDKINIIW